MGASAVVAAVCGPEAGAQEAPGAQVVPAEETMKVTLSINGRRHEVLVEARWSLLHVLREKLGLTGAKMGCDRGECGGCTVLIDDLPRYACMTLAVEAEGKRITTLEGLLDGESLGNVQEAFVTHDAYQCGYCTPGQIMAVEGLLRANPNPGQEDIRRGISGNICRCGAYANIVKAAETAARTRSGGNKA